jgi:hypothetical protein
MDFFSWSDEDLMVVRVFFHEVASKELPNHDSDSIGSGAKKSAQAPELSCGRAGPGRGITNDSHRMSTWIRAKWIQ